MFNHYLYKRTLLTLLHDGTYNFDNKKYTNSLLNKL